MQRVTATWAAAAVAVAACAQCCVAQDAAFASGFMAMLPVLRPAKTVVRTVRAAAPYLFLNLEERLREWGYPLETHTVRTEDGYLLTLHRIPRGRQQDNETNSVDSAVRPPVILQHGIISCSEYWVLSGREHSASVVLADNGYDVWLTNVRGNHYALKHEKMNRRDPNFWKFSWHEMGMYDVPAVIDYVLNATKQEKLFFVSHSMGCTLFYVAMTMRPEYNNKIRLHVSMAPGVYFNGSDSAAAQVLIANAEYIKAVFDAMPTYELFPKSNSSIALFYLLCGDKAYFNKLCAVLFSWFVGAVDLNNTTNLCLVLSRSGSSTSALVAWHFVQIIRADEFQQMDYGIEENKRKYGTPEPPKYPLDKVTAPVAVFGSTGDLLIPSKGVKRLAKTLPNVVSLRIINETFFNHMDYADHPKLKELVLDPVLETMKRF